MNESEVRNPKANLTAEDILNLGLTVKELNRILQMPLNSRQVAYLLHFTQRTAQRHLKALAEGKDTGGQHHTIKLIDVLTFRTNR